MKVTFQDLYSSFLLLQAEDEDLGLESRFWSSLSPLSVKSAFERYSEDFELFGFDPPRRAYFKHRIKINKKSLKLLPL